ncbi:MAG: hypothetical protein COZ29_00230 [Candidatus Moranbacteria bacterium CG_4_10_14_3_um_filter_45_9]|nr:MAG: hypothetical protein AUK19_02215 [Candidatus Moranbacteria bacterium CG2_30_45_14]PIX90393.1 MAG: hypothetical protein COZ29_00230 [Candidatus Moranbacteria bacterium CG_4_10_14_3_um_filter_45_9]PJA85825.1 MAG: hypothetical protein CO143_00685 [Candidatus Moranbacteria bacterium CG_4_9_14_3_um_filter_45_14]
MAKSKKNLIEKKKAKDMETLFFVPVLEQFLLRLPERSRDIVASRFGISDERPKTLEEIGHIHEVTRERVRQIIMSALGFLSQEHKHHSFIQISTCIHSTLEEKSGIVRTEELLSILAPLGKQERGALLVFIECLPTIKKEKATEEYEKVYILKENFSFSRWKKVKDMAKLILQEANKPLVADDFYSRFQKKDLTINQQEFFNFLAVAKDIRQNVFGEWGLVDWSDIKPRGTREKAYLVLKTTGTPLHFRKIASLIDSYGLKSSKKSHSHPQTVHNELIKDKRFVLVGRGTYALSEWGYKKGTVKEVLEEILKKADKPLSREEVLIQLLKIRQVKKSTVVINLNTFFQRVGKNAYSIKK